MMNAPKPSSSETAQAAVKAYFAESLFDADAARYRFPLPPVQGSWIISNGRHFGWFLCGEINGKNRMGGYTGFQTFFAYFSPRIPRSAHGVAARAAGGGAARNAPWLTMKSIKSGGTVKCTSGLSMLRTGMRTMMGGGAVILPARATGASGSPRSLPFE
jgi:hypothetical protein